MKLMKYRAWHKSYTEMYDVSLVDMRYNSPIVRLHNFDDREFTLEEIELIQFTGLYDTSGKEIWEGDYVKVHIPGKENSIYFSMVYISPDGRGVLIEKHPREKQQTKKKYINLSLYLNKEEVENTCNWVGNIFENPEMDLIIEVSNIYNVIHNQREQSNELH